MGVEICKVNLRVGHSAFIAILGWGFRDQNCPKLSNMTKKNLIVFEGYRMRINNGRESGINLVN